MIIGDTAVFVNKDLYMYHYRNPKSKSSYKYICNYLYNYDFDFGFAWLCTMWKWYTDTVGKEERLHTCQAGEKSCASLLQWVMMTFTNNYCMT